MPENTPNTSSQSSQSDQGTTSKLLPASDTSHDGTPVGTTAPATQTTEATKPDHWSKSLPDDLKAEKTFETIPDVPTLAKSYLEVRKKVGASIVLPGKDAKPEDVTAFYTKLGVPEKVEDYKVQGPILPPGLEMKPEEIGNFSKIAHSLHMTPEQVQGVLNYYGETLKGVLPDYKGDSEKAVESLKGDWGMAIDRNLGLARRALYASFPEDTVKKIEQYGLANDVGFIKGMFERGRTMVEEGVIQPEIAQGLTDKDAINQINEMEGDAKSPLYDKAHPRHQEFVDKRNNLYKVAYPTKG